VPQVEGRTVALTNGVTEQINIAIDLRTSIVNDDLEIENAVLLTLDVLE
jgi:hypothetical protein